MIRWGMRPPLLDGSNLILIDTEPFHRELAWARGLVVRHRGKITPELNSALREAIQSVAELTL